MTGIQRGGTGTMALGLRLVRYGIALGAADLVVDTGYLAGLTWTIEHSDSVQMNGSGYVYPALLVRAALYLALIGWTLLAYRRAGRGDDGARRALGGVMLGYVPGNMMNLLLAGVSFFVLGVAGIGDDTGAIAVLYPTGIASAVADALLLALAVVAAVQLLTSRQSAGCSSPQTTGR